MQRLSRLLMLPLALAMLLFAGAAFAVGTAADTEITNQASASFNDSSGQAQRTTSNQVVTVVQQVYGVSITPNGTDAQKKSGLAGSTVYFNYVVGNTGNGLDTVALTTTQSGGEANLFTFGSLNIYEDENCNGNVDSGEDSITSVDLEADASMCAIVAALIPSTATEGQVSHVDLVGTADAGTDATPDNGNWGEATATANASFDARLTGTPEGQLDSGDTISYTFSGSNTGGDSAHSIDISSVLGPLTGNGIVLVNALPANTTYVHNSLTGSAGAGTASVAYRVSGAWTETAPAEADVGLVTDVALVIRRSGGNTRFFTQGASYEMSFSVKADAALAAGTKLENAGATLSYATSNGGSTLTVTSNTYSNTIAPSYGVVVGPDGDPDAGDAASSYTFKGWTIDRSGDTQTVDTATSPVYSGDTVYFKNTLQNTGTTDDTFSISVSGTPTDWSCTPRHADGDTPLSGNVGPLAKDATFDFAVACILPSDNDTSSDTATLTVTASSVTDSSKSNTTTNSVPSVAAGYAVTLQSNSLDSIAAQTLAAGDSFTIPLEVTNDSEHAEVFDFTSSIPANWTAVVHHRANCAGTAYEEPTTRTSLIAVDATECFTVVGTTPFDEAKGTSYTVSFTATSTSDTGDSTSASISDTVTGTFTINTREEITLDPDRSGTVTSPGTISYTLNLRNGGNEAADVALDIPASSYGWSYQLSNDGSTWVTNDTLTVSGLGAGTTTTIHVRVIVPSGQPLERVETRAVTAVGTFTQADGVATETASDSAAITTTVVGGDLTLENSADVSTAAPGDDITYTLVATNIGTADISEVILMIPLPSFTEFQSVSTTSTVTGEVLYYNGSAWSPTAPTTLSVGESVFVGIDTDGDNTTHNISAADTMGASETITVTLVVKVK